MQLETIKVKIVGDNVSLKRAIASSGAMMRRFANVAASAAKAVKVASVIAAAAFAVGVKRAMSYNDELAKTADKAGIATEQLAALRQVASLSGVSADNLTASLRFLRKGLGEAMAGTGQAMQALDSLGLSAEELSKKTPTEQLELIAESMDGVTNSSKRTLLAMQLFGKSGEGMLTVFGAGAEALREAAQRAEFFGTAISRIDASKIEQANDAASLLGERAKGAFTQITVQLAPALAAVAEHLAGVGISGADIGDAFKRGIDRVAKSIDVVKRLSMGVEAMYIRLKIVVMETFRSIGLAYKDAESSVNSFAQRMTGSIAGVDMQATGHLINLTDGLKDARAELLALENQMLNYSGVFDKLEEARAAAEAKGREAMERANALNNSGNEGGLTEEQKERLKELNARLEQTRVTLSTERELEMEQYKTRIEDLREFHEQRLITDEEYADLRQRAWQDHVETMSGIQERGMTDLERFTAESFGRQTEIMSGKMAEMTAVAARSNKAMFQINKMAGIANALMKVRESANNAYAWGSAWGGPVAGAAAAAVAIGATIANVNAMRSQSFESGGAAPSVQGGSVALPVSNQQNGGTNNMGERTGGRTTINIRGEWFPAQVVRDMVKELAKARGDGAPDFFLNGVRV